MFLVLIYYIHDLPKQKLLQRKVQFVANEMAAVLQNIAKQKSTPITREDLKNAARLVWLSMLPGLMQYGTGPKSFPEGYMPLGYNPHIRIHYIVGTDMDKAVAKWTVAIFPGNPSLGNASACQSRVDLTKHETSIVGYSEGSAKDIYPTLKISKNEVKIIVEVSLVYFQEERRYFSDGRKTKDVAIGQALNFLLASPRAYGAAKATYFPAIAIFTPIAGAFSERAPN